MRELGAIPMEPEGNGFRQCPGIARCKDWMRRADFLSRAGGPEVARIVVAPEHHLVEHVLLILVEALEEEVRQEDRGEVVALGEGRRTWVKAGACVGVPMALQRSRNILLRNFPSPPIFAMDSMPTAPCC